MRRWRHHRNDNCNITVVPSFPRHLPSLVLDHSCVVQPGAGSRLHVHEDWVRVEPNSLRLANSDNTGFAKPDLASYSFYIISMSNILSINNFQCSWRSSETFIFFKKNALLHSGVFLFAWGWLKMKSIFAQIYCLEQVILLSKFGMGPDKALLSPSSLFPSEPRRLFQSSWVGRGLRQLYRQL